MDRGEDEFDGPFRGQALGFERIGEAEAADGQVGTRGFAAVELEIDILAFGDHRAFRQKIEIRADETLVEIGRADLDRSHAAFAGEEPRERDLELAVGEEEHRFAAQGLGDGRYGGAGALAGRAGDPLEIGVGHAEGVGGGAEPGGGALLAERERRGEMGGAPALEQMRGVAEERLRQQHPRVRADRRGVLGPARRETADRTDAEFPEKTQELVLDHVGQRADEKKLLLVGLGQGRHHRRETGVLALGEGGLDAGARVAHHSHMRGVTDGQALGGAGEVEFDDLRRAGPDEEELADVGAALQQSADLAVDLVLGVGETGEVLLLHDRGAEARLGEDHHAGGRLQQMRAGARADHEEEGVLHLAVQPDDAGQAAEHLALAPLTQDRRVETAARGGKADLIVHAGAPSGVASERVP